MEYLIMITKGFSLLMVGIAAWLAYKKDYAQATYQMTVALMLWLISK